MGLKNESPTERQILDYLAEHPAAQDTLRGIVEWWILKQKIARTTAEVEAALARLVASGKLSVTTGADGRMHYRQRPAGAKKPLE